MCEVLVGNLPRTVTQLEQKQPRQGKAWTGHNIDRTQQHPIYLGYLNQKASCTKVKYDIY